MQWKTGLQNTVLTCPRWHFLKLVPRLFARVPQRDYV